MAKFSYTQNGITFKSLENNPSPVQKLKGKYFNTENNYQYSAEDGDPIMPAIDAIVIDWNGAQVSGKTLNTTGEMLSILQTAYNYATTYTGKTSLTSSSVLGTINGQSLKFGGSITIETGSDYTHPTFSGVTGSYGTSAAKTLTHGGTFNVPYITVNNNGHITVVKSYTLTLPTAQTTVTGNAGTATTLATARTLTIGSTGKTFDGSANVAWTLAEIGAAATSHKHTYTDVGAAAASHTHTYSAVGAAAKNHQHTEYANAVHEHSNYAIKSHASTATTYGVGTSANYGHLKISNAYTTQTTAADIALSLGGAYNMYKAFVTRISELAAEITALKTRVTTLEGYHATKPVTAVTVTPESITLYGKGETSQLSYAITPTDASNKSVTWSSGATSIATVTSVGVVTTVAIGSATITAAANDGSGKKDTCAVTVKEARISAVSASDITATFGGTIAGINASQTVQSGDGAVFTTGFTYTRKSGSSVTVNSTTGALTIASAGTSYITVTSKADTTKTKEVKVTVNKASDTVTIKEGSTAVGTTLSKTYGNSLTLTATTKSGNAVTWDSSDKTVATINNGVVTILKTGTTTITAAVAASTNYNAANDTVALTVNAASQSITLSPTSLSWSASDALTAKQINVTGNKGTISASSNNTNITATVSGSTVTVTPKAYNQNATITVKADAVSGKYSEASTTASVTVDAQAVKYYWYINNGEDIVKGDVAAGDIDWSKAQQVTSFESLGYTTSGTKITMNKTGVNSIYILCPKAWSNKWAFWSKNNDIDLTTGFLEVGEIFGSTFIKNNVEYDLWWFEGFSGNTAHIKSK